MKTILNRVLAEFDEQASNDDFPLELGDALNSVIARKLISLLKISCGIDLTVDTHSFNTPCMILEAYHRDEITYKFPYGSSYISIDSEKETMDVSFYFNSKSPIRLYKNRMIYLSVDNDMAFEKLELKHIINYVDTHNKKKGLMVPAWAALLVYTELDKSLKKTYYFNYQNVKMFTAHEENIINLFDDGLNPYFLSPSDDFDEVFFYFLNVSEKYQDLFYEIFPEQIIYLDLMSSHTHIISFLNMFHDQYHENKELIKSRLSLFEMRMI
jgi:hypothetical protein